MNDKELLELAAKAAGWKVVRWTDDGTAMLLEGMQTPFNALHVNPHSDCMGDALRLAVKLNILQKHAFFEALAHENDNCEGDYYIATRRAIVRAAAEIGRMRSSDALTFSAEAIKTRGK